MGAECSSGPHTRRHRGGRLLRLSTDRTRPMKRPLARRTFPAVVLTTLAGLASAQTVDVGGVRLPTSAQLAGSTLALNGSGVRYRFVVKVYAAGLYLGGKAATPEQAFAMAGPKRVHIVALRELDANDFGRLFTRAMQDNASKEDFSRSINGTIRMGEAFAAKKRLAVGESIGVDWLPGQGTQIMINGKPWGEPVKEPEFFNSMLRIWLGKAPVDDALKEALLGREAKPVTNPGQQ